MPTRADIVATARTWLDTPFHHRERQKGVGVDCAGLLIGIARELGLVASDFDVPEYLPQPDGHTLLAWCREYMGAEISRDAMQPGDAVVFVSDKHPQHLAIVGDYLHGGLSMIHACNVEHPPRVVEQRLMFSRNLRFVSAFAFPGIE